MKIRFQKISELFVGKEQLKYNPFQLIALKKDN